MPIGVAGREARARKIRPVGRIGPDLRFKADGIRLPVQQSLLSLNRSIEIVSRIDLQAGLIGQEFEDASGSRRFEPCRKAHIACAIEAEIVVVALPFRNCCSSRRIREPMVEGVRKSNGVPATVLGGSGKRNGVGINREKAVGQNRQPVIENARARRGALEIEEAVVGQVDDRGTVGAGCEADRQFGRTRQAIGDANVQSGGIPSSPSALT